MYPRAALDGRDRGLNARFVKVGRGGLRREGLRLGLRLRGVGMLGRGLLLLVGGRACGLGGGVVGLGGVGGCRGGVLFLGSRLGFRLRGVFGGGVLCRDLMGMARW